MPISIFSNKDGLDFVLLANDVLELTFLPAHGGRLISLKHTGQEFLWVNPGYLDKDLQSNRTFASWPEPDSTMGSWVNLGGSKTWPAPQGWSSSSEWPGPPDAILDSGPYSEVHSVDSSGKMHLKMTSGEDHRTGIQITRSFEVPSTGANFTQNNIFRNHSPKTRNWSIWEVCQVATRQPHFFNREGFFQVNFKHAKEPLILFKVLGEIQYVILENDVKVPVQNVIGKIGFTNSSGVLTWNRPDGISLKMEFTPSATETYPDGGCAVELWLQYPLDRPLEMFDGLHPDAHLAEMEILSSLQEIEPNEEISLEILWSIFSMND